MVRAAGTVCSHYGVQKTRGDQGTLPPLCKTLAAVEFTIAAAVWKNHFITTGGNTIMHALPRNDLTVVFQLNFLYNSSQRKILKTI
jgi:hypothetical protein